MESLFALTEKARKCNRFLPKTSKLPDNVNRYVLVVVSFGRTNTVLAAKNEVFTTRTQQEDSIYCFTNFGSLSFLPGFLFFKIDVSLLINQSDNRNN